MSDTIEVLGRKYTVPSGCHLEVIRGQLLIDGVPARILELEADVARLKAEVASLRERPDGTP